MTSDVLPARSMRMKALGANFPAVLSGGCSGSLTARAGKLKTSTKTPANPVCNTVRRDGRRAGCFAICIGGLLCSTVTRGAFDRLADAHIGAAAADVACHCCIDIGIVRVRGAFEQRRRRHDLARLAIAALDHFEIEPRLLHPRASRRAADAFNRSYGPI